MKAAHGNSGLTLAEEIEAYARDFELIRVGMLSGCARGNPYERLEHLWRVIYNAAPDAGGETSDLIVAHRHAIGTFKDQSHRHDQMTTVVVEKASAAHGAALVALCRRLGTEPKWKGLADADADAEA